MTHSAINFEYIRNHKNAIDRIADRPPLAVKIETPANPLTETEKCEEIKRIADRPNNFHETMRAYEYAVIDGAGEDEYTKALYDLARAVTLSVLRKLHKVGSEVKPDKKTGEYKNPKGGAYSIIIESLIRGVQSDRSDLDRIAYATENATAKVERINRDGETEVKTIIVDTDCNYASKKLASDTLTDAFDLVQTAVIAILDETKKAESRAPLDLGFMEGVYTRKALKTRIILSVDDPVKWAEVETMPIREAFRAVRRAVENTRAVENASNKYTYIEREVTNEDGETETVYDRLPMYSNLAGEVTDISGKVTYITADRETVDRTYAIIKSLNLNDRQADVLRLHMSGYGYDKIAERLGVPKNIVPRTLNQIQRKMWDVGIHPKDMTERPKKAN